jgi:hypothetical protein
VLFEIDPVHLQLIRFSLSAEALSFYGTLVFSGPYRPVWFFPFVIRFLVGLAMHRADRRCEDAFLSDGDNRIPRCLAVCSRNLSQMCDASIVLSRHFSKLSRALQADSPDSPFPSFHQFISFHVCSLHHLVTTYTTSDRRLPLMPGSRCSNNIICDNAPPKIVPSKIKHSLTDCV